MAGHGRIGGLDWDRPECSWGSARRVGSSEDQRERWSVPIVDHLVRPLLLHSLVVTLYGPGRRGDGGRYGRRTRRRWKVRSRTSRPPRHWRNLLRQSCQSSHLCPSLQLSYRGGSPQSAATWVSESGPRDDDRGIDMGRDEELSPAVLGRSLSVLFVLQFQYPRARIRSKDARSRDETTQRAANADEAR